MLDKDFTAKIYKDYHDFIKLTVKNTIHSSDPDDVSMCIHDVIMAVVENIGLDEHPNIRGWLVKTAKNIARDYNRQKSRNREHPIEQIDEIAQVSEFTDSLIEEIEWERMNNQNYVSIIMESDRLNDNDVILFNLLIDGLNDEKIAETLDISKGAASVRRSRLKIKVQKILNEI